MFTVAYQADIVMQLLNPVSPTSNTGISHDRSYIQQHRAPGVQETSLRSISPCAAEIVRQEAHSPENPARLAILTLSALWPFIKKLSPGLLIIPRGRWSLPFFL